MKLAIVIPVYNEKGTIEEVVRRVHAVALDERVSRELVIVDDGSTDGTRDILARLEADGQARVILHKLNQGKGAALRTGFEAALAGGADVLLVQDADLEYDPAEYPRLLKPILDAKADVVFGSRFIGGDSHRVLYFWHSVANRMLTLLSNALTNLNLTDMEVCYKVFRAPVIRQITIKEDRFGFEPEITAKVARARIDDRKCRVYEVGVSYSGRTYSEGKKITWRDGVRALVCIVKYNVFE